MENTKIRGKKKVLFILVLWALIFFVVETATRGVFWVQGRIAPVGDRSLQNEWEWADVHLREGKAVLRSLFLYDPHMGWKTQPNLKSDGITTNSQGMRNKQEFAAEPEEGRKRLLFVGDSYTFGLHARDEECFPYVLNSEYIPDWEVLNMAVSGTGTDQQIIMYEKYGRQYHPDIVILGFFVLDYFRNLVSFRNYSKPCYVVDDDRIRLINTDVISPEKLYEEYASGRRSIGRWYDSYFLQVMAQAFTKMEERSLKESADGWKILAHMIGKYQKVVHDDGSVPVWVIIPSRDAVEKEHSRYEVLESLCEQKCTELGLACLNFSRYFREERRTNPTAEIYRHRDEGGHLSPLGHELAAEAIYELLLERELVEKKK